MEQRLLLLRRPREEFAGKLALRARGAQLHGAAAGAGRVQQDAVKGKQVVQIAGIDVHHRHARGALPLHVVAQALRADFVHFAGRHHRLIARQRGDLRRLAAGRRRHIQHVLAGFGAQQQRRDHRGQALQVDLAAFIQVKPRERILPRAAHDHRVGVPGHRARLNALRGQPFAHGLRVRLQRVRPQRHGALRRIALRNPLRRLLAVLCAQQLRQIGRYSLVHRPSPLYAV